ncbi:hypothetical protein A9264_11080 [Vibrio sp. UCD-FRSSP16_10]|uniref:polysaccharide lyase family 7 protein n=1 Tax=unclassified Vibrio TaxID=2614977 RepID=UPI0008010B1A|nr:MULTISPECIES: polysaccharide lyase family 7 protein [unclassified Vibrio]OBT16804.1 hypothetical protein A9260_11300 [Vibrio sp. UCD-FRSSP16_30]OBT21431.1 hypothetical protein A9264_11080 [Vibrio sp. UCD-FRSSP16_10]
MILKTKRNYIAAVVAAALSVGTLPAVHAATVSIENSSFESSFDGWADTDPSAISGDANTGSASAKITGSAGKVEQVLSVDANTTYLLSAYIKGSGEIGVDVAGETYSSTGGGDDFEEVTLSFNSGSATSVTIYGGYNGDEGRFDDFTLVSSDSDADSGAGDDSGSGSDGDSGSGDDSGSDADSGDTGAVGSCSTSNELTIVDGFDDGTNDGHGPENAYDNNTTDDSRWSSNGVGKSITFDLGAEASVTDVAIQWYKGNQRSSYFEIDTSTDNSTWTNVLAGGISSGADSSYEDIDVEDSDARYVRITGSGNSAGSSWNSIIETQVYGCDGTEDDSDTGGGDDSGSGEGDSGSGDDSGTGGGDSGSGDDVVVGSCNIDMSIWGYTVGDGVSMNDVEDIQDLVDNKTLGADGEEEITFENGCVTFQVANEAGSSGGSSYPRSELRELITRYTDGGDANVTGLTKNNWVTSEASSSNQDKVGGVDGNMKATLVVNTVSVDADSEDQIGRIIVGQIHGEDHEPVKIYYRKLPEHDKGSVFFTVDDSSGDPGDRINIIGFTDKNDTDQDASGDPVEPENGIALGDEWSYEIDLTGDQLKVTVWHDGYTYTTADSIAYTKTRSKQLINNSTDTDAITIDDFYSSDYMYFKAGLYNQNKSGTESPAYASVTFTVIDVTHD